MSTSVKLKFRPSKVSGKKGIVCMQLIHERKIKLLRTRFHLYPHEWNAQKESIQFENAGFERIPFLQSIKEGLEAEVRQAGELICLTKCPTISFNHR